MARRIWFAVMGLMFLFVVSESRELKNSKQEDHHHIYNHTLGQILVEYASAVYVSDLTELFTWTCSRCNDMTKGFEMVELIVDVQNCLQAFVGVAHDLNSIIISFRGTQGNSVQNWIEDLFWKQLDLNYPEMPDAMVHHGFYSAYHNTSLGPGILNAVERTRDVFGDIQVMVTGHSMGGAMASFCALDLTVNHGIRNVQLITFGQPRIGNAIFASYFNKNVPHAIRVINGHDVVPHLPPYYYYFPSKTYHHFAREVWLNNIGFGRQFYNIEKICDDSGEDPTCSRSVSGNSVSDHLTYYGIMLKADTWGSCKIIMSKTMDEYQTDPAGNVILSRIPNLDRILKQRVQDDGGINSL